MISLSDARDELRLELMAGQAVTCPCCTQLAKIYRRSIHARMARDLIRLYRADPGFGWLHFPTVLGVNGGDTAKLAYWSLIEADDAVRADGSRRTGWWRLTERGEAFVCGRLDLPKYAKVYDGRVIGFEETPMVFIRDCLGSKFDYTELMAR